MKEIATAIIFLLACFGVGVLFGALVGEFKRRRANRWRITYFPVPPISEVLTPYAEQVSRSIEIDGTTLVFRWKSEKNSMTTKYDYFNLKSARKHYAKDFIADEIFFATNNQDDLLNEFNARKRIENLEEVADKTALAVRAVNDKADVIETNLNQLKQELGEDNV